MESKDSKLHRAGFTMIRERDRIGAGGKPWRYDIWAKTPKHREWHVLEQDFPSKAARRRRMNELLENLKIIEK